VYRISSYIRIIGRLPCNCANSKVVDDDGDVDDYDDEDDDEDYDALVADYDKTTSSVMVSLVFLVHNRSNSKLSNLTSRVHCAHV